MFVALLSLNREGNKHYRSVTIILMLVFPPHLTVSHVHVTRLTSFYSTCAIMMRLSCQHKSNVDVLIG